MEIFGANKMAPGVSKGIFTQAFVSSLITDLHSHLKNSKYRIQYGGQVNLINFYKPEPHFGSAILNFF